MKKIARKSQITELCGILRERTSWGALPEGYERTLLGKEIEFSDDLIRFLLSGGRVSPEVVRSRVGLVEKGNPAEAILTAVQGLYWVRPSRDVIQKLIEESDRTGFHFTCFLADWFQRKQLQ